jgi:PPM family protein phosphatase
MLFGDRGVDVAHVGDSRAYCIRAGQIYPLTRDHSMVQGMIDAGMISEAEAIGHPDANKITRALGMKPEVEVEVRPEPMELFPGDILLQSSDGLTDLVLAADILGSVRQSLASGQVPQACNQLVQLANDRGGHDNITVQMVRVVEVAPRAALTIPQAPAPAIPRAALSPLPDHAGPSRPPPPQETVAMIPQTRSSGPGHTTSMSPPQTSATLVSPSATPPTAPPASASLPPMSAGPPAPSLPVIPQAPAPAWSPVPVQPTAIDRAHAPGATLPETPAKHAYAPLPPQGGRLPPYAPQLPLPPPSARYSPAPRQESAPGAPSTPLRRVSGAQGGIVFVIIGMSAVIAVLLLVLIWALFLR